MFHSFQLNEVEAKFYLKLKTLLLTIYIELNFYLVSPLVLKKHLVIESSSISSRNFICHFTPLKINQLIRKSLQAVKL